MLAIEAVHARIDDSFVLYVPDLSLMVAGDISYKDMHQWLAESPTEDTRNSSIAAHETIAVLKPAIVLSSHKQRGVVDDVHDVFATIAPFAGLARSKRGRSMNKSCTRGRANATLVAFILHSLDCLRVELLEQETRYSIAIMIMERSDVLRFGQSIRNPNYFAGWGPADHQQRRLHV